MAVASLSNYDGSTGTLVDTKVDCIDETSPGHEWAVEQLQAHSERSLLHADPIIYIELIVPEPSVQALDALLDLYETLRTPLPWACASLTAALYRSDFPRLSVLAP